MDIRGQKAREFAVRWQGHGDEKQETQRFWMDLLQNVLNRGEQLRAALRRELGEHPNVGDIRGRGLFVGVEFVADRADKRALDPKLPLVVAGNYELRDGMALRLAGGGR